MTADKKSISLQVQTLPYTTLSLTSHSHHLLSDFYIDLPKILCAAGFSLPCVQVLQCMPKFCPGFPWPGVTNIPVCIQPCSGTAAPHRPSLRGCLAPLPGGTLCACLGTACPQLLAEGPGASRGQSDGWWSRMPSPHHLLPFSSLPAQRREEIQGTVQGI